MGGGFAAWTFLAPLFRNALMKKKRKPTLEKRQIRFFVPAGVSYHPFLLVAIKVYSEWLGPFLVFCFAQEQALFSPCTYLSILVNKVE